MRRLVYFLVILLVFAVTLFAVFFIRSKLMSAEERACINSGGAVTTFSCCRSASDFPNSCTLALCDCSPAASYEVKFCNCGYSMCFNGTTCVVQG